MRWLINYIRSCFCKHEWELLDKTEVWSSDMGLKYPINRIFLYRCKKCGMEKRYQSR